MNGSEQQNSSTDKAAKTKAELVAQEHVYTTVRRPPAEPPRPPPPSEARDSPGEIKIHHYDTIILFDGNLFI